MNNKIKICGVVVWYNPKKEYLENIKSYLYKLDELYIIDNSNYTNFELAKNLGGGDNLYPVIM